MRALAVLAMVSPVDAADEGSGAIQAARAGDLAAFEILIRRYERLVLSVALRLTGNLEDAQDASQEVFLKLYKNLHKVEAAHNFSGWLYRVTVNVCHDLRKKRPSDLDVEHAGEISAGGADPQQRAAEEERRRVLALSLRMLPEKERAALVLRDLEGLSTAEVARALGSTEATVRSQVSKARVKVKDFMERYFRRRS